MIPALAIAKIATVPVLLYIAHLMEKRWGAFVSAVFIGMPIVSGPVSFIITLEQGREFGATMAFNVLPGILACVFYGVVYSRLARRLGWQVTLAATIFCYAAFAAAMCLFPKSLLLASVLALAAPYAALAAIPKTHRPAPPSARKKTGPPWAQMIMGALVMIAETGAASFIGPQWSGIIMFFPVMSGIVGLFAHIEQGAEAVSDVYRGNFTGLSGAVVFALIVAWCLPSMGTGATYALATTASLFTSVVSALLLRRSGNR